MGLDLVGDYLLCEGKGSCCYVAVLMLQAADVGEEAIEPAALQRGFGCVKDHKDLTPLRITFEKRSDCDAEFPLASKRQSAQTTLVSNGEISFGQSVDTRLELRLLSKKSQ